MSAVPSSELGPPSSSPPNECASPLDPKGEWSNTRLQVRGDGGPILTTGRKAWHSVYSELDSIKSVQSALWGRTQRPPFWSKILPTKSTACTVSYTLQGGSDISAEHFHSFTVTLKKTILKNSFAPNRLSCVPKHKSKQKDTFQQR